MWMTGCTASCEPTTTINIDGQNKTIVVAIPFDQYSNDTQTCFCNYTLNIAGYEMVTINDKCSFVQSEVGCGDKAYTVTEFEFNNK